MSLGLYLLYLYSGRQKHSSSFIGVNATSSYIITGLSILSHETRRTQNFANNCFLVVKYSGKPTTKAFLKLRQVNITQVLCL